MTENVSGCFFLNTVYFPNFVHIGKQQPPDKIRNYLVQHLTVSYLM